MREFASAATAEHPRGAGSDTRHVFLLHRSELKVEVGLISSGASLLGLHIGLPLVHTHLVSFLIRTPVLLDQGPP